MMYKKTKGFSLAELLISLLIISIVLAAAIPTITKRNAMDPEKIWNWGGQNNVAYFGAGHNQSAIIGYDMMPYADLKDEDYRDKFFDKGSLVAPTGDKAFKFTTAGDRLVLVKRFIAQKDLSESFVNSHISFYNIEDRSEATTRDLVYAGRIASDQHNLAFGIASLLSYAGVETDKISNKWDKINSQWGYNTSLGHYTLSFLKQGTLNTAVGESALTYNFDGNSNTATGAFALNQVRGSDNTAIGANAGKYIDAQDGGVSEGNTLIGAHAMSYGLKDEGNDTALKKIKGSYNTAIGTTACGSIVGDYNICVGKDTGAKASGNILEKIEDNYGLYIGQDPKSVPLISGHIASSKYSEGPKSGAELKGYNVIKDSSDTKFDKELNINAKHFRVRPFNGHGDIFQITAYSGKPPLNGTPDSEQYGYDDGSEGRFGVITMGLKDIQYPGSAFLGFSGSEDPSDKKTESDTNITRGIVNLYAYDPFDSNFIPLNISDAVTISQEKDSLSGDTIGQINSNNYILMLNNSLRIEKGETLENSERPFIVIQGNSPETQVFKMFNSEDIDGAELIKIQRKKSEAEMYLRPTKFNIGETSQEVIINGKELITINSDDIWFNENIQINSGNIKLTAGDVNIAGLALGNGSIKEAISAIKQHMDNTSLHGGYSDARLKNISGDSTAGLKEINALEVKNYTYKKDEKKTPHVGVIAQQLQKVFPNSVFKGEDGYLRIKTEEIFYAMVNSIKELFEQVQDLTAKVVGLDKRITELEKENAALKKQNEDFEKRLSKLEAKMAK